MSKSKKSPVTRNVNFEKILKFWVHVLIMVARGPCSAFGTIFLLLHPGMTDQEPPIISLNNIW